MIPILIISALLLLLVLSMCWRVGLFDRGNSCHQELNWFLVLALLGLLWVLPSFVLLLACLS